MSETVCMTTRLLQVEDNPYSKQPGGRVQVKPSLGGKVLPPPPESSKELL